MKRLLAILAIVTLLGAISAAAASAAAPRPPVADAWTDINAADTNNNTVNLWIRGSTTACTPTNRTYLRWDLTGVNDGTPINSATLTLNVNAISGDFSIPRNATLYQVTNDAWNETTLTWNNQPALGTEIQTVAVSGVGQVTFNNANLAAYVDAQAKGDNLASFALDMTGNCTVGTAGLRFDSKETTTGTAANLQVFNPNAVDMSSASAERTSWPLYAGLAAVALVVVAGVMMSRRRTA